MTILKKPDLPDDELHCAVVPTEHIRLGDAVAQIGRAVELSNDDFAVLEGAAVHRHDPWISNDGPRLDNCAAAIPAYPFLRTTTGTPKPTVPVSA
ncbi:hypothetical protein NDR89_06155 [Cupriavidus gilardii]|uniref:Uncharacterized protein n=1 Tax=Cupriavidus gilardii TaxID=82541 RepID=A0ABY4VPZ1_9BURK|nr:hypothetical protein [Cupriavidus gilardii]USE76845.1 hypothetical protein NDR89_06155 [Cupriavidus gilardii]